MEVKLDITNINMTKKLTLHQRQKNKNYLVLSLLVSMIIIFFIATIVKLSAS